jgi:hypothetical protein
MGPIRPRGLRGAQGGLIPWLQDFPPNRKPQRGNTGVFSLDDQIGGDLIVANIKQHLSMIVQVDCLRPRGLRAYAAGIGSTRIGSLFLTLPTRALAGHEIMSSEV